MTIDIDWASDVLHDAVVTSCNDVEIPKIFAPLRFYSHRKDAD